VVADAGALTPGMRRIRLRCPRLDDLAYSAGQDLMLAIPADDGRHFRRRYTIRGVDRHDGLVDLDFVMHGHGPAARWAATAVAGDRIEAIGPRGKVTLDPTAQWHLWAGDESAVPATFAMIEALAPGATAWAFLDVVGPEEQQQVDVPDGVEATVSWLHRGTAPAGAVTALAESLASMPLPPGRGHAYVAGEMAAVAAWRDVLLRRGLAADQISPKSYWRLGRANAEHGEPLPD
jgi:NADPH-dependent ferric siderophore reductase